MYNNNDIAYIIIVFYFTSNIVIRVHSYKIEVFYKWVGITWIRLVHVPNIIHFLKILLALISSAARSNVRFWAHQEGLPQTRRALGGPWLSRIPSFRILSPDTSVQIRVEETQGKVLIFKFHKRQEMSREYRIKDATHPERKDWIEPFDPNWFDFDQILIESELYNLLEIGLCSSLW